MQLHNPHWAAHQYPDPIETAELMSDKDKKVPDSDGAEADRDKRDNLEAHGGQEQADDEVEAHLSGALGAKKKDGLPGNP